VRVTITIDEGEIQTVASAGEGAANVAQTGAEQVLGPEPIDGGPARAVAELEAVEAELTGGQGKGPEVSGTGPIDAGPAPVLAMDGESEGPLPLGGSLD
jgi:hypothetical protein